MCIDRAAAHEMSFVLKRVVILLRDHVQYAHGLTDYFGADAITGKKNNLCFQDSLQVFDRMTSSREDKEKGRQDELTNNILLSSCLLIIVSRKISGIDCDQAATFNPYSMESASARQL